MRTSILILILLACTSCAGLSYTEQQQYENLIAQGAEPVDAKSPALAACLNLVAGLGDVYNGQWGAFALDFLLWTPSVIWAVPQGAVTANNINKRETLRYYTEGPGQGHFDPNLSVEVWRTRQEQTADAAGAQ